MSRYKPLLPVSFPADAQIAANTVVIASGTNSGNVALPSAAGNLNIIGVTQEQASSYNSKYNVAVNVLGIVKCRFLTGTAIAFGDKVKIADTSGRVTKVTPDVDGGAGTLAGVVGVAQQALASGAATDTLIEVLLTPGVTQLE